MRLDVRPGRLSEALAKVGAGLDQPGPSLRQSFGVLRCHHRAGFA